MNEAGCRRIGYIAVDVLNNATVCNEALGLIEAGVPLEVVSVRRFARPTYSRDDTLAPLVRQVHSLCPLGFLAVAWALLCAPLVFGRRFWKALGRLLVCPCEGWRQRLRLWWHFLPAACLALRWRRKNIGHIHAHWAHTATTIAMHASELLGVGFSFTGHANDLFVHRVALAAKARRARFVVCISEYHRRLYRSLGAPSERLPVVYCGIDTDRFRPTDGTVAGAPERRVPRILAVGRLVEKKGFHDLLDACALLARRGLRFECVIAGSGPEEERLREMEARLGLDARVEITGRVAFQEELLALLHSADIFALPCVRDRDGDMDGLPQVLMEAMAAGLPVVSTDLVGIPDLVRHGVNGLLVGPGVPAALAAVLERLLVNPALRRDFGAYAALWARLHFGRHEAVRRLRHLFLGAAARPGREPPAVCWEGTAHPEPRQPALAG